MMKVYTYPAKENWEKLVQRPSMDPRSLEKKVRKILESVKKKGDKALLQYTKALDGVKLKKLQVSTAELRAAGDLLGEELKKAIQQAKKNIETFHGSQIDEVKKMETMPGVCCWRKTVAIEKVGLYVPGGTAPLFSTVLMAGVPAQLAGCKEIILTTPPSLNAAGKNEIHPAILYAAQLCGITKIYKVGGAQAIAAMAYGTGTIPKVNKIFGPGNQYVTCAKQWVQLDGVAIDMPAGPSEVLVIADETAVPAFVAADMLSQAEHGTDSQAVLVSSSAKLAEEVDAEIARQLKLLPRKEIAGKALLHSKRILVKDMDEAIAFSNLYAPEHLILACKNAEGLAEQVTAAGSVFIGNYSPESAGDYASGTNHILPTSGSAASFSGVSVDSFVKKISYQQLTREGLENIGSTVMVMAAAEGLEAHKNAVSIRLKP